jgi:hypothetical protein
MIEPSRDAFLALKKGVAQQRKLLLEITRLKNVDGSNRMEKRMLASQVLDLKSSFKKTSEYIGNVLEEIKMVSKLEQPTTKVPPMVQKKQKDRPKKIGSNEEMSDLEETTLKRIHKGEKKEKEKKIKKPSKYIKFANKLFADFSRKQLDKGNFRGLGRSLSQANIRMLPKSYLSVVFLTTIIFIFVGLFTFIFFLFFNIGPKLPIITMTNAGFGLRLLKTFWIVFLIPALTFLVIYFYPSLEKKSIAGRINQELPFATIHMSSISESMIEPSKIFSIIVSTKEYPNLEKEFIKILNSINVLGYDLVTSLRQVAFNSPSQKLTELLNGLATTINSGGDLPEFFEKRAQSLLFDYRLEREKATKSAETFMDIYISVVIAAPMILMLLLMMMKISGLGISLSTGMISLIMVLAVSVINVAFLTFLQLRNPIA